MLPIFQHQTARRDLVGHFVYLAENVGMAVAERFLVSANASFAQLAEHPDIGALLPVNSPALTGVRKWRVKGFDHYLIFYLAETDRIRIVRVLHAASDWWQILGMLP